MISQVLYERRQVTGLLAECDLLQGRPEAARTHLLPVLDRSGGEEWNVIPLLPFLAWAHLELGDVPQAEDTLAHAFRRARAGNHRLALVEALRVQALLALQQEDWTAAHGALEEGLALARTMPYPYAEGRFLHLAGLLQQRSGQPEPARTRLREALAIFQRLGARADLERVEHDLGLIA
jgi:tetratricopeptide (TPR) repeat protein